MRNAMTGKTAPAAGLLATAIIAVGLAAAVAAVPAAKAAEAVTLTFVKASKTVFSRPHDVILSPDRRYLLVADLGNNAVRVVDPQSLEVLADIGRGMLSGPHDVTFDERGRLLVADSGNDRIVVFGFDGLGFDGKARVKLLETWDKDMGLPEGVAAGNGGRVYVTNAYLDTVLALEDGRTVLKAGGDGRGPNQYGRPHDIHVDGRGRVLVVDSGNARIQVLDRDLAFQRQIGGPPYDLNEPKYITVDDATGHLFISDQHNNRILILDNGDTIVGIYGGTKGSGPGELNWPEGVEVEGPRVWVSDTYNNRIIRLERR